MRSVVLLVAASVAAWAVDFNREIRPILSENCFACHGPDEKKRMAGLRLDTRDGAFGKNATGSAFIVPSKASESLLFQRVSHANKALRMPPTATGRTLTEKQVDAIKRWIDEGATWKSHWSYEPPKRPEIPAVATKQWPKNAIDQFVLARLEKESLKPSPEADRITLLRRVTFDLTGLPPTGDEVKAFVEDKSKDAYEKVVDRLLRSPHYGEKMALHWLDLSRYADSHGYHIDSHRDMWPWRDWVIRSFTNNKRFDEFVVEQIAGDLLPFPTPEQRLATGFNRNHMINYEGGAIPEEYQTEYVIDRVETTANVFMGMTMGCARCHDHKYDPLSQRDFYRFFAFFNSISEKGLDGQRGNAAPRMIVSDLEQQMAVDKVECEIRDRGDYLARPEVTHAQKQWESAIAASWRKPVKEGLLAHYEFDGNLADSSGNYGHGRFGKKEGGFTNGAADRSLLVKQEDEAILTNAVWRDSHQPFTVTFWVRPQHERQIGLFEKGRVKIYSDEQRSYPILKRGAPLNFDFAGMRLKTAAWIQFGPWSHVALSYDGSGKASGFQLQLNGKPSELRVVADALSGEFSGDEPLMIRESQSQVDDLRFYGRVITADEIEEIFAAVPAKRTAEIERKKRSREDNDRLQEYFLTRVAPAEWREKWGELKRLREQREQTEIVLPTSMTMQELDKPRDSFVLARGDYRNHGEKVTPAVPAALPPLPQGAPANRLGLAKWLVDPSHPLTARVTVNRLWQNFFGVGIVKTSEDFGSQGEPPSHAELLDWMATEFVRTGWDVKAMVKQIAMSATYRQASKVTPELHERDPENRLLARMSRFRLPAELVRDNALAVSGLLNDEVGGRSVYPYQPPGLWEEMAIGREFSAQWYTPSTGKDLYRRSMYTFWKRTVPPASLSTFDAPDREKCASRRPVTNTPLQALVLMNDPTYVEAARNLAQKTITEGGATPEKRIAWAYQRVLARRPSAAEVAVLKDAAAKQAAIYASNADMAKKLLAVGESKYDARLNAAELAAWTNVSTMILNLDEAITKE